MFARLITAAALAATLVSGAAMAATAQETAPAAEQAAAETEITRSDARKIARDYVKEQGMKGVKVSKVRSEDDGFVAELESLTGIKVGELKIDSAGNVTGG